MKFYMTNIFKLMLSENCCIG